MYLRTEYEFVQNCNAGKPGVLAFVLEIADPKAHRLTSKLLDAVALTVTSDMRFREAERIEALGLDSSRAIAAREGAKRHNKRLHRPPDR